MEAARKAASRKKSKNLRVVRGGRRQSLFYPTSVSFFLIILCGYAVILLLYVIQLAMIGQNGLEIDRLSVGVQEATTEQEQLLIQVKILKSPQRIENIANRLGMVRPTDVDYLHVPPQQVKLSSEPHKQVDESRGAAKKTESQASSGARGSQSVLGGFAIATSGN